ncbi:MAG: shikimate kinase, partial [Desulfatitalea sp.]|nr:shikimate kinase [Desulfatitalea sp.]
MNIYLIGYRCTGKTTLGQALARRLDRPFVDTDDAIVADSGQTISEMVAQHGWADFRARECKQIESLARRAGLVIATGGGVVLDPDNVAAMRVDGTVVWLRCRPETIARRMRADTRSDAMRPSLTGGPLHDEIETTLAVREPLYRQAMHLALDT